MSKCYDLDYDERLLGPYISQKEFEYAIKDINAEIFKYWPCSFAIWIGYILAPFTLGFSFMLPNLCLKEVKKNLLNEVTRQNRIRLERRGIRLKYVAGHLTSWLELEIIKPGAQ